MSIYEDARKGTLVGDILDSYIKNNPNILNEQDPNSGLTPLATAVVEGFPEEVSQLLQKGANAGGLSRDGETPLLLAAWKAEKDRSRIIQLLLENISPDTVDKTCSAAEEKTPLILAVEKKDVDSIRMLRKAGAALQTKSGRNAEKIAAKFKTAGDASVAQALSPEKEKSDLRGLAETVIDYLLYVIALANKSFSGIIRKVFGLDPELNEKIDEKIRYTEEPTEDADEFLFNIDEFLETDDGGVIRRFFKGNDTFMKDLAQKVVDLKKDSTTVLSEKNILSKVIKLTLYQQVIYCDDSTSMKRDGRWENQKDLVQRITKITTRVLPDGEGVALRFINRGNEPSLTVENMSQILDPMTWQPGGDTPIGTNLRSKILEPMVYEKIKDKKLSRPLLIIIITDGMPEPESKSTIIDAILECGKKLKEAGYPEESVKFVIGQIGTAKKATEFLDSLRNNPDLGRTAYITSDKLDEKFSDLKNNERGLDQWLIETLLSPFQYQGSSR